MKQAPCCARLTSQLHHQQNNLRTLARRAAMHDAKGNDITKLREMISNAKAEIQVLKGLIDDHEAQHAAEFVVDEHGQRAVVA